MIINDVYARSASLLASQFQELLPNGSLTNFQKLIFCYCQQIQQIQNVLQQLLTKRSLNTSVGAQLDGIGQIVGLSRIPGQPDDTETIDGVLVTGYRQALQFQIFYNNSQATPEEIIFIAGYITNSTHVRYIEYYPAAYQVIVNGLITDGFFGSYQANSAPFLLKNAGPVGVAYPPITTTNGVPKAFAWSSDVLLEPFYVSTRVEQPSPLQPFEVNPGSGAEQLFVQRGEITNPVTGGGFSEYYNDDSYNDTTDSGQFCEVVQLNGNLPP